MRSRFGLAAAGVLAAWLCLCLPWTGMAQPGAVVAEAHRPVLLFSTFESRGMGRLFRRILEEAYARIGYVAVFAEVPAERSLVMSNDGAVDGEAGRVPVIEPRCPNLIRVPTPIYTNRTVVFTRQDGISPDASWEDLTPYRVGVLLGYRYIEKRTALMHRVVATSYAHLFNLLLQGRVDLAVVEYFDVLPALRSLDLKTVRMLQPPLAFNPMHHYLHRRHADLVPRIDKVLRDMAAEGRMLAIQREMEAELGGLECPFICPVRRDPDGLERPLGPVREGSAGQ
ncbi:MAG: transporter substrate-binding domain-containing protein [Pseudodesulfovibrio sp.]